MKEGRKEGREEGRKERKEFFEGVGPCDFEDKNMKIWRVVQQTEDAGS
jgi:hypothetical protein